MLMADIDFLIIGAAKSATTWLQRSLTEDPSVIMPAKDLELHYFSREFHRGDGWYFSHFAKKQPGQIAGERSNSYLNTPNIAARIHKVLPHAKLVAQLRNPVDRAYSDYCMLFRRGEVSADINHYLDPRTAAERRFLTGGRYSGQLESYLAFYPASQILVLLYEDMKSDPARQLTQARNFLGLAGNVMHMPDEKKVKDKTTPMVSPELRKYLHWLKPAVAPFRKTYLFEKLHRIAASELKYPELQPDLRKRMANYYVSEVEALKKLLKRDLTLWE
jgi:Sulfotransferase domain